VKPLKNKDIKPSEEIRLPELEIHGVWKKIINWTGHIRNIYWLISITVFLALFLTLMPHYLWIDFWSGLEAQGTLVGMVLIFSLVAVSLVWSIGQRIDVWVFMYFNMHGRRAPWLDWMMLGFTQIGNGIFAMVVALILFLSVNHLLAYELTLGTLTLWLVVELMKVLFHRTRPYIKLKNIRIVGSRASGRSFPSGHTSQSFFMVTLLLHYYHVDVYVWLVLYAIAFLVGITRIYVGMHYPRDVIGGAILGIAWGLVGVIINSYIFSSINIH
jgi:membrane-associated phospholipid phosphatase